MPIGQKDQCGGSQDRGVGSLGTIPVSGEDECDTGGDSASATVLSLSSEGLGASTERESAIL